MRKTFARFFLAALLLACQAARPGGVLAENSPPLSIVALKAETPGRWRQTYAAHGRTIVIDVPIYVPEVDKLPVLRGETAPVVFPAGLEGEYQLRGDDFPEFFRKPSLNQAEGATATAPAGAPSKREEIRSLEYYLDFDKLDWDQAYAPNNPMTLSEAWRLLTGEVERCQGKALADSLFLDRVVTRGGYLYPPEENGVYRESGQAGRYVLRCFQKLAGAPVLTSAQSAFSSGVGRVLTSERSLFWPKYVVCHLQDAEHFTVYLQLLRQTGVLSEDVPLSSFAPVKAKLEEMIAAGQVRNIFTLRLGYVRFLRGDGGKAGYDFFPCWVAECDYAQKPAQETNPLSPEVRQSYNLVPRFVSFVFNAQTGEMIDPGNVSQKRSRCPEVIGGRGP